MSLSKSLRVRKQVDYKLLNDGEFVRSEYNNRCNVVRVLPESYTVERIIYQKKTEVVSVIHLVYIIKGYVLVMQKMLKCQCENFSYYIYRRKLTIPANKIAVSIGTGFI